MFAAVMRIMVTGRLVGSIAGRGNGMATLATLAMLAVGAAACIRAAARSIVDDPAPSVHGTSTATPRPGVPQDVIDAARGRH